MEAIVVVGVGETGRRVHVGAIVRVWVAAGDAVVLGTVVGVLVAMDDGVVVGIAVRV